MRSLSPERLAALVDESPTLAEQMLLESSPALRAELAAMRRVVALASYERTHPGPPLTSWGALAGALREDGLVRASGAGAASAGVSSAVSAAVSVRSLDDVRAARAMHDARARRGWRSPVGMAAAAALLVTVGALGGRLSGHAPEASTSGSATVGDARADGGAGADAGEGRAGGAFMERTPVATRAESSGMPSFGSGAGVPSASVDDGARAAVGVRVPVRDGGLPVASGAIPVAARLTTREQAVRTLQQLEDAHQQAVSWLAANDSSIGGPRRIVSAESVVRDLRRQIEVLDAAVAMGRRALYETPDDPVMNRYYFSALAAREVLLRKLAVALPASQQVLEY